MNVLREVVIIIAALAISIVAGSTTFNKPLKNDDKKKRGLAER